MVAPVIGPSHRSWWGFVGGVNFVRGGERVVKFLVKGWGDLFFGQGERRNGVT
jgi:hypothetical protein